MAWYLLSSRFYLTSIFLFYSSMKQLFLRLLCVCLMILPLTGRGQSVAPLPTLKVSENQRYLVKADGSPFFWLGDTAWELFHRLDREEATRYLENRAALGFTVIQAVALAELDGHKDPNPYGHLPLVNLDPANPAVTKGANNDYWDHVDFIVDKANTLGLYIAFLPTWGRYWHDNTPENNGKPLFTVANAQKYGEFLGKRYGNKDIIWVVGGDRHIEDSTQAEINRALARGLRAADGGRNLISFHPSGGRTSSLYFHRDNWLDFNMRQNGHVAEFTARYAKTREDYDLQPPKPVLDGEPIYEDHPVSFNAKELGHSIAYDVRCPLYWNLFTGAFGHTYGHHSIWQMFDPAKKRNPINNPLMPWHQAIYQPGAAQMQFARRLLESRPFLSRIPDTGIIVTGNVPTAVPGAGRYTFVATRDQEGTYAMVFAPVGRPFTVNMSVIRGERVIGWWFNPRNGEAVRIGEMSNQGNREFISPSPGEFQDWVLVLDDASRSYPPPGRR
jgi:hypothetical protein